MALYTDREDIDMIVYLVYDDIHGFRGVFAKKEKARELVEHISIIEYGMRTTHEIWDENYLRGNEMVWYTEEELQI